MESGEKTDDANIICILLMIPSQYNQNAKKIQILWLLDVTYLELKKHKNKTSSICSLVLYSLSISKYLDYVIKPE